MSVKESGFAAKYLIGNGRKKDARIAARRAGFAIP
jgi:hypothetical protein